MDAPPVRPLDRVLWVDDDPDVLALAVRLLQGVFAAERALLKATLAGAVQVLIDILALTQPAAFGRAHRIRQTAKLLAQRAQMANAWEVEMAAMLSHIGCISVPQATLQRVFKGTPL